MTKITFINAKADLKNIEGSGEVNRNQFSVLEMRNDDFVLIKAIFAIKAEFYKISY